MKKMWRHKCPTIKEVEIVDINGSKIAGWTILAALWWRTTNTVMDIIMDIMELLLERWIP